MNLLQMVVCCSDLHDLGTGVMAERGPSETPSDTERCLTRFLHIGEELLEAAGAAPTAPPGQDATGVGGLATQVADALLETYRVARTGQDQFARILATTFGHYFDEKAAAMTTLLEWSSPRPS